MGDGQGTGDVLWGQEASQGREDAGTQGGVALSPSGQEGVSGVPDVCWDVCLRAALVGAVVTLHKA